MHIIEGETIQIPVNITKGHKIERHEASLKMSREGMVLKNLFERIKIDTVLSGMYHLLNLEGLEAGDYELNLNLSASQ